MTSQEIDQGNNQPVLINPVEKRGKTTKVKFNKMATSVSLSTELMEQLMMADYCNDVDLFARDQPTSKEHFRAFVKRTSSSYTVDTTSFFTRKGNPIPGGIYSLFGKYNGKNADEVRDELISWVCENRPLVTLAGENVLKQDKKDMAWWMLTTTNKKNPADELALWCLCKQFYRHAVVYTPDHTWTTLKDKSVPIEQIDTVCDIHLIYMGYGKFGLVKPISEDHVKSTDLQPAIQESRKVVTAKPKRTAIQRTRHGQHPARSTSAHINYKDLNKGLDPTLTTTSQKGKKRKRVSELTLREPSSERVSAQAHINPERQPDQPVPNPDPIMNKNPPQAGHIIGTAIKMEVKQEQQKAEDRAYEEILGPRRKRLTTAPKTTAAEQITQPTPTLYTHAYGHQCTRKNCDPIVISKRGIIKPSRPVTAHTHISKYICDKMSKSQPEQSAKSSDTLVSKNNKDINEEITIPDTENTTTSPTKSVDKEGPPPANILTVTADIHTDSTKVEHETPATKSTDRHETELRMDVRLETTTTADVHVDAPVTKSIDYQDNESRTGLVLETMTTADSHANATDTTICTLVVKNIDHRRSNVITDTTEISVKHLGLAKTIQPPTAVKRSDTPQQQTAVEGLLMLQEMTQLDAPDPNELPDIPIIASKENTEKAESDDTIIYDLPDPKDLNIVSQTTDQDPQPRKGILKITNVGIKSKTTDSSTSEPVGPITNEGKLRCDFCMRSFNTRTEKNQHMNRRHATQLAAVKEQMAKQRPKPKESQSEKTTTSKSSKIGIKPGSKKTTHQSAETRKSQKTPDGKKSTKSMNTEAKQKRVLSARTSNTGRVRTFNCSSCDYSFNNQSSLNTHYKEKHPPVQCTVCDKYCATPNTLARHMYKHKEHPHKCKICKQDFAFKSELEGHLIKHQAEPGFYCEECDKSFMRFSDLTAHTETHSGEIH